MSLPWAAQLINDAYGEDKRLAMALERWCKVTPENLLRIAYGLEAIEEGLPGSLEKRDPRDPVYQQLLPTLAQRAAFQQTAPALHLRAAHYTSARNRLHNKRLRSETAQHLLDFSENGIDTLVFKGVSLAELYPEFIALRGSADLDLLVRESQFADAVTLLRDRGWQPVYANISIAHVETQFRHGIGLKHPDFLFELDVHCHVNNTAVWSGADEPYWERSVPGAIENAPTRFLATEDAITQAICHGVAQNYDPPIRWVGDVLRLAREAVNWRLVLDNAVRTETAPLHLLGLHFLNRIQKDCVPEDVLQAFAGIDVPKQRLRHWSYKLTPWATFYERVEQRYLEYRVNVDTGPPGRRADQWASFLKSWAGEQSVPAITRRLAQWPGRWLDSNPLTRASERKDAD